MSRLRRAFARIVSFVFRNRQEANFEDEMAAHLEMAIDENIERGMSVVEARRQAMLRFGTLDQAR